MESKGEQEGSDLELPSLKDNLEAPSQFSGVEQPETRPNEEQLLSEVRRKLQEQSANIPDSAPETPGSLANVPLAGFREQPGRVIRNFIIYPDMPKFLTMAAITLAENTAASIALEPSVLLQAIAVGNLSFLGLEAVGLLARSKKLSKHLYIRKIKPTREKVLADGTRVGLDNTVGEFHLSGLYGMIFKRNKMQRGLIIGESVIRGLIGLAEEVERNDPNVKDFTAFRGTSTFVSPRLATRLGFEVSKPEGLAASFYPMILPFDKFLTGSPSNVTEVHTAWISRQGIVAHKGDFQRELTTIQSALNRRTT